MTIRPLRLLLCLSVALGGSCSIMNAQVVTPEDPAGPGRLGPISLASHFFDGDYFNYFLFANGVYDSFTPVSGTGNTAGAFGYSLGGGANLFHRLRRGSYGLSYNGAYTDYSGGFFSSGTSQNLNFNYNRRLGRRWFLNFNQGAGILFYSNSYQGPSPTSGTFIQANPFSSQTRYVITSVSTGYQFTRRLSVSVGGNLNLQRYTNSGAIGNTGVSGNAGVSYRITARTTVSGGYNHDYYRFQRGAGDTNVDGVSLSIFHYFSGRWNASLSGGILRSNVTGFVTIPVFLQTGPNMGVNGFITGRYNSTAFLPSFFGSVTRNLRQSSINVGAGQSVVSGNGYYLASRNQFINGGYSRALYRSNFQASVNYYRLKSVANTVRYTYSGFSFGGGYSYTVSRHLSANVRYDFLRYGTLRPFDSVADNRITFGVSYSSKSIPLTPY